MSSKKSISMNLISVDMRLDFSIGDSVYIFKNYAESKYIYKLVGNSWELIMSPDYSIPEGNIVQKYIESYLKEKIKKLI